MRRRLAALLLCAPLAAAEPVPAPAREELQGLASVFEQAVRQTASPAFLFAGFDAPRSFYLPGVGAVIVLSPRALPIERRPLVRRKVEAVPYAAALRELEARLAESSSPEVQQALAQSVANLRRLQRLHAQDSQERALQEAVATAQAREAGRPAVADVRELELQVLAMQEEAERARREAEERLEQLSHEVRLRLPLPPEAPAPPQPPRAPDAPDPAVPPVAPAAPRTAAPWAFWFEVGERSERPGRSADATVAEVRAALFRAIEAQGPRLTGLSAQEGIVVAVELVSADWPGRVRSRRTLVARVSKKDLDARAAGKLGAEDFAKKVQLVEY